MATQSLGQFPNFIYKAYGKQGATILVPHELNGKIKTVKYIGSDGSEHGTAYTGGSGFTETNAEKYNLNKTADQLPGGKVQVTLDDGTVLEQDITNPTQDFRNGKATAPQNANSGPGNFGGGGVNGAIPTPGNTGNIPNGFAPGNIGFGAYPSYLGNQFPSPVSIGYNPVDYKNIQKAPFNFTDPTQFAAQFGAFNRSEVAKNQQQASAQALDTLNTELQGLTGFVPVASALKRQETSVDNQFNQSQRTAQVNQALPGVNQDLNDQAARARTYASGGVPDAVADRALNLSTGSQAADIGYAGGFGSNSSATRKLSDLLSADARINLSKYGDQLLSSNITAKTNLNLAPTEYSNAGSQINVNPTLSASQLTQSNLQDLNNRTLLSPSDALGQTVQQNEFDTNLSQSTREFNATNRLQSGEFNASNRNAVDTFNATNANNFGLDLFNYKVGYAGTLAGAQQTNINTQTGLAQQAQYQQIFSNIMQQAQSAAQTGAIAQGVAAALPTIIGAIGSLLGGKGTAAGVAGTTGGGTGNTTTPTGSSGGTGSSGSSAAPQPSSSSDGSSNPPGTIINTDGSTVLTNGSAMPAGYHATQTVDGGQVIEPNNTSLPPAPDGYHYDTNDTGDGIIIAPDVAPANPVLDSMQNDGINIESLKAPATLRTLVDQSNNVSQAMGVSATPSTGSVLTGYNTAGKPQYSTRALVTNTNPTVGQQHVSTFQQVMAPLGVFQNKQDATALDNIATAAGDVSFAATLTDMYQKGNKAGFANTIAQKFQQPILTKLGVGDKTQQALSTAFGAYNLYNQWGQLSPAQKSIGLASLGLQGYKTATGTDIAKTSIIKPSDGNPGLNVGQALGLFQAGYNVYSLAKNWNQLNTIQKIAAGSGDAAQIAQLAQSFKLLGNGTQGALPGAQAASAAGSGGSAVASGLTDIAGVVGVGSGALQVYNSWGKGGKTNTINGAIGGTAIAAGLYTLGATNPYVAAGIIAASALGANVKSKESQRGANAVVYTNPYTAVPAAIANTLLHGESPLAPFKSGKSADQMGRDAVRDQAQKVGIADKNYQVTLADGTKADIGADGRSGSHTVSDPSKWVGGKAPSTLHSYDTDYTNDLDYTAALGGISLSRLTAGGKNTPIDQVGAQIGNATLQNIGNGQSFSAENFNKLAQNQKAVYAQAGIKSKSEGYALAQQAYKEGRIDATDLVTTQQSLNMIYDKDGYQTAQKLMAGRFRGIEVATKDPAPQSDIRNPVTVSLNKNSTPLSPSKAAPRALLTKEQVIANNKSRFGNLNSGANL